MRTIRKAAKLGQNFLSDPKILEKIADAANIKPEDTVVEIGPGRGALTQFLLERATKVIAIEKDEILVEELKERFKEVKKEKLEIINADILDYQLPALSYKLIGNIPYYITGEIFRKFLESKNPPSSITFVIQKEVAERIVARDGKESVLSISIKAYGTPEYGGIIKAGSFTPVPKVDSGIISIRNISKKNFFSEGKNYLLNEPFGGRRAENSEFPAGNIAWREREINFFRLIKKGFAHKRKFLIKNLELPPEIFQKCSISEKARAENLKVEDWLCLTRNIVEE